MKGRKGRLGGEVEDAPEDPARRPVVPEDDGVVGRPVPVLAVEEA